MCQLPSYQIRRYVRADQAKSNPPIESPVIPQQKAPVDRTIPTVTKVSFSFSAWIREQTVVDVCNFDEKSLVWLRVDGRYHEEIDGSKQRSYDQVYAAAVSKVHDLGARVY
jgi:hypothetical protein